MKPAYQADLIYSKISALDVEDILGDVWNMKERMV